MSELNRRIGRREAVRIAILGLSAFLAGCSEKKVVHWGAINRNNPQRKKLLAQLRSGPALSLRSKPKYCAQSQRSRTKVTRLWLGQPQSGEQQSVPRRLWAG